MDGLIGIRTETGMTKVRDPHDPDKKVFEKKKCITTVPRSVSKVAVQSP